MEVTFVPVEQLREDGSVGSSGNVNVIESVDIIGRAETTVIK